MPASEARQSEPTHQGVVEDLGLDMTARPGPYTRQSPSPRPSGSSAEGLTGSKPSRYTAVPGQEDEGDEVDEESTSGQWNTFHVEGTQHSRGVWERLRSWKPLGLEQSPELWAIAIAYYVQGVKTEMAYTAEKFLLKDDLGLSPAKTGVWRSIAHMPWNIKPLYGFITDTFPLRGERRRPYMFICGIAGAVAFGLLGGVQQTPITALILMTCSELSIAFIDVTVDGIVVERSRLAPLEHAGALQSLCWGSQAAGRLSSAYTSGWMIHVFGARPVLLLMALFPLLITAASRMIREPKVAPLERVGDGKASSTGGESQFAERCAATRRQAATLLRTILLPAILLPAIFIFVWHASPSNSDAMFYFYTNHLLFTAEFIGRINLLDGLAQLLGVFLFERFLKRVELRLLFLWLSVIGIAAGLTQLILVTGLNRDLGLPDKLFVICDSVLLTGLGRVAMMPVLVLAARICPEGIEATLYAALMSISNLGSSAGDMLGAGLVSLFGITASDFANLPWLVLVTALAGLVQIPFILLVPRSSSSSGAAAVSEG